MLVRAKNFEAFKYWIKTLLNFYLNHIQASIWFLTYLLQNKDILSEILLECRDSDIRSEFSLFLSSILQFCSKLEEEILLEKIDIVNLNVLPYTRYIGYNYYYLYIKKYRAASSRFIEYYLTDFLNQFKKNCRRFDDYLLIIKEFANCGNNQKIVLISAGAIQELLNNINDNEKFNSDNEIEEIYKLLESLICCTRTYAIRESKSYPPNLENAEIDLDSAIEAYLNDFRIRRNFINNFKLQPVENIILHLSWENIKYSLEFLEEFSMSLITNKFDNVKVISYMRILEKILKINDNLKGRRVGDFLNIASVRHTYSLPTRQTFFEQIQKCKDNNCAFTMAVVVWWSKLLTDDTILESTKAHSAQFRWITVESFSKISTFSYEYFSRGSNLENDFQEAVRKFRIELDSDSEESVEIELDRYRYREAVPATLKEDGESTESDNP